MLSSRRARSSRDTSKLDSCPATFAAANRSRPRPERTLSWSISIFRADWTVLLFAASVAHAADNRRVAEPPRDPAAAVAARRRTDRFGRRHLIHEFRTRRLRDADELRGPNRRASMPVDPRAVHRPADVQPEPLPADDRAWSPRPCQRRQVRVPGRRRRRQHRQYSGALRSRTSNTCGTGVTAILELPLTDEQSAIATGDPDARILVTAGAGTGKTHLLIARVIELADEYDLQPGGRDPDPELLSSRSRRDPQETSIRRRSRVDSHGDHFRLVRHASSCGSVPRRGLGRPRLRRSHHGRSAPDQTSYRHRRSSRNYRHIIVDELQDLVAVRADLVRAILGECECGFTLFGDPAQGIYNFQAEGAERVRGAHLLFKWLEAASGRPRAGNALDQFPCRDPWSGSHTMGGARAQCP